MSISIREMTIEDYDAAYALWQACEGIGLSSADSREGIARLLERNPGLSSLAEEAGRLAGAVLGSTDGRRGYLHHLAVDVHFRRRGIGRALVERSLDCLRREGIQKCHIFVYHANLSGIKFWEEIGYQARKDLILMSREI